jgi:hypothetical protein
VRVLRSADVVAAEPTLTPFITVEPLAAFSAIEKVSEDIVGGKFTGSTVTFTDVNVSRAA